MARSRWLVLAAVVLVLVIGVAVVAQSNANFNQSVDEAGAFLRLQAYCYGHVALKDSTCADWASLVMDTGSDYGAVKECDRTYMLGQQDARRFAACLIQHGFRIG